MGWESSEIFETNIIVGGNMQQKSIKKNMLMSIINTSSNFVFPLITYSYVARILHTTGTGKVAFVQSVLTYFSYIASLGISGYGMRECAKVRDDKNKLSKMAQELLIINLVSTFVSYILLMVVIALSSKLQSYRSLFWVMSCSILLQTLGMEWLYSALEEYSYITIRSLIFKTISVILIFVLVKNENDYVTYGALTIFTTSASNILNFVNARKYISFKKYKKYDFVGHIRPIMTFFMSAIIITVYSQFDTVMLGFMRGDEEVGIYNTALKIKTIVISISTGLTSVLIPRMSVYYQENYEKFCGLLSKSFKVSLNVLLPLVLFIFINAKDVIIFLCGTEYLPAISTLRVLLVCVFVLMLTNLFGNQVLIPKGNEKRYTQSVFLGLWINLILNYILIPLYGSLGAAIATLITETSNAIWMAYGCKDEVKILKENTNLKVYIIALLIAITFEFICICAVRPLNVFWRLVFDTLMMFGVYYVILLDKREDIICEAMQWIRNLKNRRKNL